MSLLEVTADAWAVVRRMGLIGGIIINRWVKVLKAKV